MAQHFCLARLAPLLIFFLPSSFTVGKLNKCAMSKILGGFDEKALYASVIGIAKAHDQGHTSTVRCLKICDSWSDRNEEPIRMYGTPFSLNNEDGMFIWQNRNLRDHGIEVGSIVEIDEHGSFMKNTGKKMVSFNCIISRTEVRSIV